LKIKNEGKSVATNVSVCVSEIVFTAAGTGSREFREEVFDLHLANTRDRTVFNLAAGGHRFIDLVHTSVCKPLPGVSALPPELFPQVNCEARRDFDFLAAPVRLADLNFTRGQYRVKVFVSADNAKSSMYEFEFAWDGTLHGLQIV
jgi:hypothetical protein